MRKLLIPLVLLLGAGCPADEPTNPEPSEPPAADEQPVDDMDPELAKLVTVAREIRANPDNAESILESHGMTIESFEKAMFAVARDSEKSAAFDKAIGS